VRDLAFISYSHEDRRWLDPLLVLLKPYTHIEAWADPYIPVGAQWRREISGALDRARVAVLLVSPTFAASDFVRNEELPAILAAAERDLLTLICIPVSSVPKRTIDLLGIDGYEWPRPPERPLDVLREGARNKALAAIVGSLLDAFPPPVEEPPAPALVSPAVEPLARTGQALGELHGAPPLPDPFVPRPEMIADLTRALLDGTHQRLGIGAQQTQVAGVHGAGGLGKTVLATALVRSNEVRRAFSQGLYWLTLGEQPDLLQLQHALAQALTGTATEMESVPVATARLRELLLDKNCLLVLDDVWQASHAQAFDVLGPRGRLLVTTRNQQVLVSLEAQAHALDILDLPTALAMLAECAGTQPPLPETAALVAGACGGLPLALSLAGAQVREGRSWTDVLEALRSGDHFGKHPYARVFKAMNMSVGALPHEHATRYRELAIFPEDAAVPESVIALLWSRSGVDGSKARALLDEFAARALLRTNVDSGGRTITFHDLQGDYLRLVAGDLPSAHGRLVDAVEQRLPAAPSEASRWAALPASEAYLWRHLFHHVVEAGRAPLLDRLVGSARWLAAKIAASGVSSLVTDLAALVQRGTSPSIRQIERALRLESGWLYRDPNALPELLYNRLRANGHSAEDIHALVTDLVPRVRLRHAVRLGDGETRVFRSPIGDVTACSYSPDGARMLSAHDSNLFEWDRASGQTLRRFEGHTAEVTSCAYSSDGKRLLSSAYDGTVREWDRVSGKELRRFSVPARLVEACVYSPDGSRLLSASRDGAIREWDRLSGQELHHFEVQSCAVLACVYSADDERVLSAISDGTVREWDRRTGHELRRLVHSESTTRLLDHLPMDCAYSPDGTRILSASDKTLCEWDRLSGAELHRFQGHWNPVTACAYSPDGARIVSASWDLTVREWECLSGRELRRFEGHSYRVNACTYDPRGSHILSASDDGTIREWDPSSGYAVHPVEGHAEPVLACACADNGRILSGSRDGTVREWDGESGRELLRFEGHSGSVRACAYSPDGHRILSASHDRTLREWDRGSGVPIRSFEGHSDVVVGCAYSADGQRILSASHDRTLREWDRRSGLVLQSFEGHSGAVTACAYSPDGERIFSASHDRTLREWDRRSGLVLQSFEGHSGEIMSCAISPDGARILSASFDDTLREWDRSSGRVLRCFDGSSESITACTYAPGGAHVITVSFDGPLQIWDCRSGRCVYTIYGAGRFWCVGAANSRIAAGDSLGNVWILDCDLL
jgi:WD40 repeat protein